MPALSGVSAAGCPANTTTSSAMNRSISIRRNDNPAVEPASPPSADAFQ